MPERVFIDTSYLIGVIDPSDSHRDGARSLAELLSRDRSVLVTTDAVLIEVLNFVSRSWLRKESSELVSGIRGDPQWEVVPLNGALLQSAEARYRRHDDKAWSMTDCISMEVMAARQITDVATSDRGFAQAGFNVLL